MQLVLVLFYILFCSSGPVAQDKWSMTVPEVVTVGFREDAVLPCTFTAPSQVQPSVTVIWRHKVYKGPEIFRCISKANETEGGQNCSKSLGRYSLYGDPKARNLSLIIKDVSVGDQEKYFCRVELKEGSYEAPGGTELKIQVPQTIESIYIRTLASGEQVVTCDVKGIPLPNVTWIMPENINASLVSFLSGFFRASSSVPAYLLNTNYTCQIDGRNGLQNQSIYFSKGAAVQEHQISLLLFVAVVTTLTAIFIIIILVIVIMCYKKSKNTLIKTLILVAENVPIARIYTDQS
ncbi:sialic acid-binding Ig-like lectin 15 [Trichomycterus rosablanca]|uniref:sialic acid-binding Ig-like lectin 15 n=1 Tax=Trichomycterus rosablanca TaxID=2290929 RepID=UPI002F353864